MIEGREYLFVAPIDGKSDTPLYLQLKQQIKKLIIDGTLRPGDSLPSETEYCEYHNISRTTVRQAFSELEKEGCVTRIKGKGTFISEPKLSRTLNSLYSFSAEMARMGLKADAQIISFQTITGDTELISVCVNAGDADSMEEFDAESCDGVGLFRTEFLYMDERDYPSEDRK